MELLASMGKPKLKIGLDFDGTVSADKEGWGNIVLLMKSFGWDVRITTFRHTTDENTDVQAFAESAGIPVIYTGHTQKLHFAESIGWIPDIWIDDMPYFIPNLHQLTFMSHSCVDRGDVGNYEVHKRTQKVYEQLED